MVEESITPEEYRLIQQGKLIAAIKSIRNRTGRNLRDSKRLVDKFLPSGGKDES